jgi:2,5-furandicarboxylate decarboxylase 1
VSLAYAERAAGLLEPLAVSQESAPVLQNVWTGADADAGRLPIVKHFEMDMGPVLTMGQVMRAHEGFYDVSFIKTFYKWDPRAMVASIHTRDLVRILKEHEERDEPAPIINVLGHHPAFHLAVTARNPWGTDDYASLSSFLGEPLRLTPSVTWGDKFMVPADAEVIIEGEIPPGQRDLCDPFGEVGGIYQAQCLRPVFNVKAICFRQGAIMQDVFSGYRDSFAFHIYVREAELETALRPDFPNIVAIASPESGCGMWSAYISVRDIQPGQAEAIGRAALQKGVGKLVVVVDENIDPFDEPQVLWATHVFTDLAKGVHVVGNVDNRRWVQPAGHRAGFGATNWEEAKIIVDATRPTNVPFGSRAAIPADVMQRVRLADYLPSATAAAGVS